MPPFSASWLAIPVLAVAAPAGAGFAIEYLNLDQVERLAFPAASSFTPCELSPSAAQRAHIEAALGAPLPQRLPTVMAARSQERLLGYLVTDSVIGKHLAIDYALVLTPGRTVQQVEIMTYRESYGSEVHGAAWRQQFVGKGANAPLSLNDDISSIGGATLSCRHLTEGIRRLLIVCDACLPVP
jgi:FMN-binding domain